jgi:hypothetical protein
MVNIYTHDTVSSDNWNGSSSVWADSSPAYTTVFPSVNISLDMCWYIDTLPEYINKLFMKEYEYYGISYMPFSTYGHGLRKKNTKNEM